MYCSVAPYNLRNETKWLLPKRRFDKTFTGNIRRVIRHAYVGQLMARAADEVYLVTCGLAVDVKKLAVDL